ncbi:MAG TPA: ABC transporter permease [Lachnospiraceae bacterium]|nr:ABC transporter permease [Lachnospiraceae bacterium]
MKNLKPFFPFVFSTASLLIEKLLENGKNSTEKPYFLYFLAILTIMLFLTGVASIFFKKLKDTMSFKSAFWSGVIAFITLYNVLTAKLNALPMIFFPSPSRIIGVLVEDSALIGKCVAYSSRLLFTGFLGGAIIGIIAGIAIGFSKKAAYWLVPLERFLGPIPSTAWIPIVLVVFPDTVSASSFLIGLAVWFPTTLMTSSGINNISKSFFEVSETLGANTFQKIFKVGLPAAMPSIFIGIFNGTCSAFITLMTAEMIGAKYGIGWYVNWQKEMMSYSNVYAGLLVIAVTFSILITLLFKVKDKILVWQKGVIKW